MAKDIKHELACFLDDWTPEHLISYMKLTVELFRLYDFEDENDWVLEEVGADNVDNVRLMRTFYIISKIAYFHAGALSKIKFKYKDLWSRMEDFASENHVY